ncbi:MAG: MFS transporter [Candidatus Aenigmatarchaeota archaeon]
MIIKKLGNFEILLLSTSIASFASGLIGPFYVLYINKLGGAIENFGIAYGLLILTNSLASYFSGKYSDRLGRKMFLIASNIASAIIILFYLFVSALWHLFFLQILNGLINAMWNVAETTFLADITKKKTRGLMVGKYRGVIGLLTGIAVMVSGMIIGKFGFELMFYIYSFIVGISTLPLFFIEEK